MTARRPRAESSSSPPLATEEPVEAPEASVVKTQVPGAPASDGSTSSPANPSPARRSARIVAASSPTADSARIQRERLLARFLASEGRSAISRAADECRRANVEFPLEQAVQLQLLEHVDETLAREAVAALTRLLVSEPPLKRPILEQRLRRMEDTADEEATRGAAAELRRSLRA